MGIDLNGIMYFGCPIPKNMNHLFYKDDEDGICWDKLREFPEKNNLPDVELWLFSYGERLCLFIKDTYIRADKYESKNIGSHLEKISISQKSSMIQRIIEAARIIGFSVNIDDIDWHISYFQNG